MLLMSVDLKQVLVIKFSLLVKGFLIVHFASSILQPTSVYPDTWYTLFRLSVKLTKCGTKMARA